VCFLGRTPSHGQSSTVGCSRTAKRLGDEELFNAVTRVFTRTAPSLISAIAAAIMAGDLKTAALEAHSLKGAVAVFEAPLVLNSVTDLERHAKNADAIAAGVAFERVKPLVERLLIEVGAKTAESCLRFSLPPIPKAP
jgi:HPt (histidine-containing phosphotransfer) domain-containing protein